MMWHYAALEREATSTSCLADCVQQMCVSNPLGRFARLPAVQCDLLLVQTMVQTKVQTMVQTMVQTSLLVGEDLHCIAHACACLCSIMPS